MINIRKGMFETNSSSTHAMIVAADPPAEAPAHVHFGLGDFGWRFEKLQDENKAAYLYTSAVLIYGGAYAREHLTAALATKGITCSFSRVKYSKDYSWPDNCGIDHCGIDDHKKFVDTMLSNPDKLMSFLFNDNSYVVTGNDNDTDEEREWFNGLANPRYEHERFDKWN